MPKPRPIEIVTLAGFMLSMLIPACYGRSYYFIFSATWDLALASSFWFTPAFLGGHLLLLAGVRRPVVRHWYFGYFVALALFFFGGRLGMALAHVSPGRKPSDWMLQMDELNAYLLFVSAGSTAAGLLMRTYRRPTLRLLRREALTSLRVARLGACLLCCFVAYSNLKAMIPLINPGLHDALLYRMDCALCLGHDPFVALRDWATPAITRRMIHGYTFFFFFILYGLTGSLLLGSARMLERVVCAFIVAYGLGMAGYLALPALGPAFVPRTAGLFAHTAGDFHIPSALKSMYNEFLRNPKGPLIYPFNGLASMPSLHVAHAALTLYYLAFSRRRGVWLACALLLPFLLLIVSTVFLGMHYIVDLPAGLAVAWLSVVITRWLYAPRQRGNGRR